MKPTRRLVYDLAWSRPPILEAAPTTPTTTVKHTLYVEGELCILTPPGAFVARDFPARLARPGTVRVGLVPA